MRPLLTSLVALIAVSACKAEPAKAPAGDSVASAAQGGSAVPGIAATDRAVSPDENLKVSEAFLAANAKEPGVFTTASGLQYRVMRAGSGPKPKLTDTALVAYKGMFIDGRVFDESNTPVPLPLAGVIPGWTEALQMMPVGSTWVLWIHPKLGYGAQDSGPIPGNSVLQFEVKLVGIEK